MGGVDKGLIAYQGRPLVEWALAVLVQQVGVLVISANRNAEIYAAYGHRVLPDTLPGYPSPLAGVLAAMQAVDADWLLVGHSDRLSIPLFHSPIHTLHGESPCASACFRIPMTGSR